MADVMQGGMNADMIANTPVDYTSPADQEVLKFIASTGLWTPSADATSTDATQLQGVDIDTTSPTDQQHLVYINSTSKWTPTTVAGGGGKIVQVVTEKMDYSYNFPDETMRATGGYASITPTSATNKILIFSAVPSEASSQYCIGQYDWYRTTSAMSSGDTLSGGTGLFVTDYGDVNAKYMDWRYTGTSSMPQASPTVNVDVIDTTYASTSEQFYNLVGREYNGGTWAIRGTPWSIIIMEIDES